jgi:rhodanese-related sulfurtransferase
MNTLVSWNALMLSDNKKRSVRVLCRNGNRHNAAANMGCYAVDRRM